MYRCEENDVVHIKWSTCPAGNYNHCKGKDGYPSVAFEVLTGFDHQILEVSSVHFGTQNDQYIMKIDKVTQQIRNGWYKNYQWSYFDEAGKE